jgi:hypothetical protein
MRMNAGLSLKAVREMGGGGLDGDVAVQSCVAGLPHLAHAAGAERREDFVRS